MKITTSLPLLVLGVAAALAACGHDYDDSGSPDPASPWPWVRDDGGLAPEAGCLPRPACESGTADGGAEGGC